MNYLRPLLVFCLALLALAPAFAQTANVWTGQASSIWNDPANWSLGKAPNACHRVVIPGGTPHSPSLQADVYFQTLDLADDATFTTNDFDVYLETALPFSVVAHGATLACTAGTSFPLTASVTGGDTASYVYTWIGPAGDTLLTSGMPAHPDTLVVDTPQSGTRVDTAGTVVLFKPGFSIGPGADYTALIADASSQGTTLTASRSGLYTLTVTDPVLGCSVSDTATLRREGAPVLTVEKPDTLDCQRTSVTLRAYATLTGGEPGDVLYGWAGGPPSVLGQTYAAAQPGPYAIRAVDPVNGCETVDTVRVAGRTNVPTATLAGGTLSCDPAQPLVLRVDGLSPANAPVSWENYGSADSLAVTQPGTYTARIRHPASGCELVLTATVLANPLCAVAEACEGGQPPAGGGISYERWNGIPGTAVSDLTQSAAFAQAADAATILTSFEAAANAADSYGVRVRGYVVPPASGAYTFWIAADHSAELWLSSDEDPAHKTRIALTTAPVAARAYKAGPSQQSAAVTLACDRRYYVEALMKEGSGDDHLSVSWQVPGRLWDSQPIPGSQLSPYPLCALAIDADTTELYVGQSRELRAVRPGGLTAPLVWTSPLAHFVSDSSATDSTMTRPGADTVFVRPLAAGLYRYKVASSTDATCFREVALRVSATACGCDDCNLPAVRDTDYPTVSGSQPLSTSLSYVAENLALTTDGGSVSQTVTYLDGLGRPVQRVQAQAGGYGTGQAGQVTDLVQPIEYDALGRQAREYLPFATANAPGQYVANAPASQAAYYGGLPDKNGPAHVQIQYDASPLDRVASRTPPGGGAAVTYRYLVSTTGQVYKLRYDFTVDLVKVTAYAEGDLTVTETSDEAGNRSLEFTDRRGQTVCREVSGLRTHYGYDAYGRLRVVIPPKAASQLSVNANIDPLAGDLLFGYNYDAEGRLVAKKVPGAGTMTMSYNGRDLLASSTDAKNQVLGYVYDADLNRLTSVTLGGQEITHHYYDTYPTDDFDAAHAFGQARKASTLGLPTATDQKILGTATMLRTLTYYEEEGRAIQISSQNHQGSVDRTSMNLDFTGRILDTRLTTLNGMTVLTHNSYDRSGRSKAVCQQVFDADTPENGRYWEPVGRYGYNGIGELASKILGCGIQKVDYAHNMRGWMTKMNDPSQLVQGEEKDFFGMALNYDGVGNITNWNYRSAQKTGAYADEFAITTKDPFAYGFTYDNLYRIKTADLARNGSAVFTLGGNDGGAMGYDVNGNITSLRRTFNGSVVDDLAYTYPANTNKLSGVTDGGTNPATPNEFFAANSTYGYDANGNLVSDSGKGISNIAYNYLNLVQNVTKSGQAVSYTYDAGGQKLKADFGSGKVYDYVAGLVYVNDSLEFIPTAEGRVLPPGRANNPEGGVSNAFYRYEYQLKDHLGNLRVACRCAEKANAASPSDSYPLIVVQENHYDPWGLGLPLNQQTEKVGGSPADRFTYNGKEKQRELGWLDYGARMYDAQVGRWGAVDPMAEQGRRWSPYNYGFDNPIRFTDPDGMWPVCCDPGSMLLAEGKSQWEAMKASVRDLGGKVERGLGKVLSYTDANDAAVLVTTLTRNGKGVNLDGTRASTSDKIFAAGGVLLPAVSGSAVKKAVGKEVSVVLDRLSEFVPVINSQEIKGNTRASHRVSANKAFLEQMESDASFKKSMDDYFGVDVSNSMKSSSRGGLLNPPNTQWHHPVDKGDKGTMWLLDKNVHKDPSLQRILHPNNGKGGFAEGNY